MKELTEKELGFVPYMRYWIYEDGRVYSEFSHRFLKGSVGKNGYERVRICNKRFLTHRLVASAFIPNPNNLPVVNHKDTNTLNNCVDNLEWVTIEENVNYPPTFEKRVKNIKRGEENHFSKLTKENVLEIVALLESGTSCDEIASMYNVIPKSIRNIRNGNTWRSVTGFTKKGSTVIRDNGAAIK